MVFDACFLISQGSREPLPVEQSHTKTFLLSIRPIPQRIFHEQMNHPLHVDNCTWAAVPATPSGTILHMTQIPVGQVALFRLLPEDDTGTARAASGSLTISDPTLAYVAKMPGQSNQYIVVSRPDAVPAAGTVSPVNVTVATQDDTGADLPPVVIPFQIPGPPLPPPATHIVVSEGPIVRDTIGFTPPPDPGTGTIAL